MRQAHNLSRSPFHVYYIRYPKIQDELNSASKQYFTDIVNDDSALERYTFTNPFEPVTVTRYDAHKDAKSFVSMSTILANEPTVKNYNARLLY